MLPTDMDRNKLVYIFIDRDGMSFRDARAKVIEMRDRVFMGENPEDLLEEVGLEPDYIFELI